MEKSRATIRQTPAERSSAEMRSVEFREWGLTASAIVITLLLTAGVVSFALPILESSEAETFRFNMAQLIRGLVALVLLFDLYTIYQQVRLQRVRRELFERDEIFHLIAENAAAMIGLVDVNGRRVYNSPAYERILGYSQEELLSTPSLEQVHPDDRQALIEAGEEARRSGHGKTLQYRMRHKDGTWRVLESTAGVVRDGKGDTKKLVIVARDVTEQKNAEQALQDAERRQRLLLEQASDAIYVVNIAGEFVSANPKTGQMLGYSEEEISDLRLRDILPPYDRLHTAFTLEQVRNGKSVLLEGIYRKRDGTLLAVENNIKLISRDLIQVIAREITERKSLEEQLRQAQKMEAVGRLAGGIAHDFNNLLMVIGSYGERLAQAVAEDESLQRLVDPILKSAERAATLTNQLLAFSRQQVLSQRVIDLNTVAGDTLKMVKALIGEDIELTFSPGALLWAIKADPDQIGQVILNLCVNARDAMPQGGKLTVETRNAVIDSEAAKSIPTFVPGEYTLLSITDSGVGMSKEVQARVFEPFFTTKEIGKGTGLGLSMVYGIVKQTGGYIGVESQPGSGSSFNVYFPAVKTAPMVVKVRHAQPSEGQGETLLLVEDEETLRQSVSEHLSFLGYKVLGAANGQEAIEVATKYPDPIHVLITDMIMPKMNGTDLANELAKARPGMGTIYMSGYADQRFDPVSAGPNSVFLQKPFTLRKLSDKLRQMIEETTV